MIGTLNWNGMIRSAAMSPMQPRTKAKEPTGTLFDALSKTDGNYTISGDLTSVTVGNHDCIHFEYDKNSTAENPIIRVWSQDVNGNTSEKKIYINEIDLKHATPTEILAWQAHHAEKGQHISTSEKYAAFDAFERFGPNQKFDFSKFFKEYMDMLQKTEQPSKLNQLNIERYLFSRLHNTFPM